jgi:hypothetical protein
MIETLLQTDDKVRLFQLHLLSFMRVSPLVLSKALRQLKSTEAELESIKRYMKGRGYDAIGGPHGQFYQEMLGQPIKEEPIDNSTVPEVFHDSKALHYKLPLWPDFDLVVNLHPEGGTFDPSFRRSKNVPVPPLISFTDLEPWKFVKEEVDAHFGPTRFGDAWNYWQELDYVIPKSPGEESSRCLLIFDFNLLQLAQAGE